jgi:hypothetical protein
MSGLACPNRLGLYCQRSSPDAGTCASFGQADGAQPCADVDGVSTACVASGLCQKTPPDAGEGVCLAGVQTGQACDADAGPQCPRKRLRDGGYLRAAGVFDLPA